MVPLVMEDTDGVGEEARNRDEEADEAESLDFFDGEPLP